MASPAAPHMRMLRHGQLHKKALSFACPIAHLQATPDDLAACKQRFLYVMDRGAGLSWVLLFFREEPDEPTLHRTLDELTGDQIFGLKGMFELKPSVTVLRSAEGIISIMTHERTLLLYATESKENDAWFDLLQRAVNQARASKSFPSPPQVGPTAAAAAAATAAAPASQLRRASSASNSTTGSPRRGTLLSDYVDPFDDLQTVLADARLREKFAAFCRFSFAGECIDFYSACEEYENAVSNNERARIAKATVERFVRENAHEQVNLSAEQRRLLIAAADNPGDEAIMTLTLLQAKREIFDLMRRNFFARFVTKEKDEESRVRLREHFAGVFSTLYKSTGIDALLAIFDHFQLVQQDTTLVANFIGRRIDVVLSNSSALAISANDFNIEFALPALKTLTTAMSSLFLIFQVDARIRHDFAEELKSAVLAPIYEMQRSMDSTLRTLHQENKVHIDRVLTARQLVEATRDSETAAVRNKQACEKALAEDEAKKAKDAQLKKSRAALEKANQQFTAACEVRQEAEIKMIAAEAECAQEVQAAMDALQSLALYRMETLQNLLSRCVLSEQHVLHNFDLLLSGILSECTRIDALADLASFAETVSKVASKARRASVANGQSPRGGLGGSTNRLMVPVATPTSPRDRSGNIPVALVANVAPNGRPQSITRLV